MVLPDLLNCVEFITPPTEASPAKGAVNNLLLKEKDELSKTLLTAFTSNLKLILGLADTIDLSNAKISCVSFDTEKLSKKSPI